MAQPDQHTGRRISRRLSLVGGGFLLLAVSVVAYGLAPARRKSSRLHDLTEAQAVPTVALVAPTHVENHSGLDLPGRLKPTFGHPSMRASRAT